MTKISTLYHKLKSIVGYSIAAVVIIVAVGISGLRLILTTADLYQSEIEQLASTLLKQPVKIGRMDAKLSNLVPTLIFNNVQLISKKTNKNLFSLTRVDVGISFSDLIWYQKITPEQIIVRGMDLHVTRTVDGSFKIKGVDLKGVDNLDKSESISVLENWLLQEGQVSLEDSTFMWTDEQNAGLTWFFDDVNFLLKKEHERYKFLLISNLPNVLGDEIEISFDFVGDIATPDTWNIKSFIESKAFNLTPIKTYIKNTHFELIEGNVDVKLWLDWQNKKVKQLSGEMKLHDLTYSLNDNEKVSLELVSGIFDSVTNENNTWNISVDKFNYESNKVSLTDSKFSLSFNLKDKAINTFYVKANTLKLAAVSDIVIDNHFATLEFEKNINNLNLRGDIHNLYVAWKNNELHNFQANFSGFSTSAWKNIPKVESLSGKLIYEDKKGIISLESENSIIGFPNLFRDDFIFEKISSDIQFLNTKEGVLFDVKYLKTENADLKAKSTAAFWLPKNASSPYLDLQTYVSDGDASKVSRYLPVGIMDDSLVEWLDRGIVSGKVNKGNVIFRGKLDDFPFNNNEGVFIGDVNASNVVIDYWKQWPKIENANILGRVTGQGLSVNLLKGNVKGNTIFNSFAKIESFSEAELLLDINTSGSTHNTMQYLINSPILPKAKNIINASRLLGNADGHIAINIPLDKQTKIKHPLSYSGTAFLRDSSLFMLKDKVNIENISGTILFDAKKISSNKLSANIFNEKANLSISSSNKKISISAKGKVSPGVILKKFNIPGAKNISGRTNYNGEIIFPIKSAKRSYSTLNIRSDLAGIKSTYPEFLYKNKSKKQKVELKAKFIGSKKTQFEAYFDKKGSAVLELVTSKENTYLNKGAISISKNKAVFPNRNILYIDGAVDKFTPAKWGNLMTGNKNKSKQRFLINPVVLNLDKLKLLTINDEKNKVSKSIINPRELPIFEGVIRELYFDKMFLGKLDLKVSKQKNGLRFDEVLLSTKNMNLFSHGDWDYVRGKHRTNMDITLKSDNVGDMLNDLSYSSIIEKGTANITSKIHWLGSPTQFSIKKLIGNIKLNVEKGNIKNIDAGAGRLLGFVSLSALPRKFFGDFKDTFKSGYSFDNATGTIILKDGNAYTSDLKINSSVSKILISGRTGLVDQDYDNKIKVVPDVGGGLAGIAALLVNLPAGVGLWLFDKMTGEQFNQASTRIYNVSGSWDKPKIDPIENE